jgi:hypothetical protein
MTDYPIWVTPEDLGTFPEGTSLTLSPIRISFGVMDPDLAHVQLWNGTLPPGVQWRVQDQSVLLTGQIRNVTSTTRFEFTFRLSVGLQIADRTFVIQVQDSVFTSFSWQTGNDRPLELVFAAIPSRTQIQAVSDPVRAIRYSLQNPQALSQGLLLNALTGLIQLNYAWQPSQAYESQKDFVFTVSGLYECEISGTSGTLLSPEGMSQFVDTDYAAWQPSRFYPVNSVVHADEGKIYLCVQAGFSDLTGPTGLGLVIADGSVRWAYQDQACVWRRVLPGTQVSQQLLAQAESQGEIISQTFEILLLSTPFAPVWLTESDDLPPAITKQSYNFALQAVDPDLQPLTWSSLDLPDWLQLNIIGELSGIAPAVDENTVYTFTVTVSDGVSSTPRTFSVLVQEFEVEFEWITPSDLGTHADGVYSKIQIQAVSTRSQVFVTYGLSGGQLPVGITLNMQTGALEGFLEFHVKPKTYLWEITTTDGVEELVRTFQITVQPQLLGHHWRLSAPLLGTDKTRWLQQNNEGIVRTENLYLSEHAGYGRDISPEINICTGIQSLNAQELRLLVQHYLHDFVIQLHDYLVLDTATTDVSLLAVRAQDAETVRLWQPFTAYNSGTRVSNSQGTRYTAVQSGISGAQEPVHVSGTRSDADIMWQAEGFVNPVSSNKWPLPWYPYQEYQDSQTVQHVGHAYQVTQPGTSGGTWLPKQAPFTDNQVIWDKITAPQIAGNLFWPACVRNMRSALIEQVGWSTGVGSGVIADVVVNTQGAITQVNVLQPGSGYIRIPQIQIVGSGTGAQITCTLKVVAVRVLNGGLGWQLHESVHIMLGDHTQVHVKIMQVNDSGAVISCEVTHSDTFTSMRSKPIQVQDAQGRTLILSLDCGVASCVITQAGSGYDQLTQLKFSGREYVPFTDTFADDDQVGLFVPLAYVNTLWTKQQDVSELSSPFRDQMWQISLLKATLQGAEYEGTNSWDSDTCTWDTDQTRIINWEPASVLIWDSDQTIWDNNFTTWDHPDIVWPNHTQTVFDNNQTIWDYYRTIFDQREPSAQSVTAKSWAWWFGSQPVFRRSK